MSTNKRTVSEDISVVLSRSSIMSWYAFNVRYGINVILSMVRKKKGFTLKLLEIITRIKTVDLSTYHITNNCYISVHEINRERKQMSNIWLENEKDGPIHDHPFGLGRSGSSKSLILHPNGQYLLLFH